MLWAAIVHLNFSRIFCSVWTEYTRRAWPGWCGGSGGDDECADVCRCRRLPVTNGELPVLPVAVVPTLATSCHCSHPAIAAMLTTAGNTK